MALKAAKLSVSYFQRWLRPGNICITMILCDFCLRPAQFYGEITNKWSFENHDQIWNRYAF
jgi:hypothetical protein